MLEGWSDLVLRELLLLSLLFYDKGSLESQVLFLLALFLLLFSSALLLLLNGEQHRASASDHVSTQGKLLRGPTPASVPAAAPSPLPAASPVL